MKTTLTPPLHQTTLKPREIIGDNLYGYFKEHYKIVRAGKGEFPKGRLLQVLGEEICQAITEVYADLRLHGFYPDGYTADGDIKWLQVMKSKSHMLVEKYEPFDKPLPKKPTKEEITWIRKRARLMFKRIGEI